MATNNLLNNTNPDDPSECQNTEPREGATDAVGAVAGYPSTLALDQNNKHQQCRLKLDSFELFLRQSVDRVHSQGQL